MIKPSLCFMAGAWLLLRLGCIVNKQSLPLIYLIITLQFTKSVSFLADLVD